MKQIEAFEVMMAGEAVVKTRYNLFKYQEVLKYEYD